MNAHVVTVEGHIQYTLCSILLIFSGYNLSIGWLQNVSSTIEQYGETVRHNIGTCVCDGHT